MDKVSDSDYEKNCWEIFGGVPSDIEWAKNTIVYKNYLDKKAL